MGRSCDASDGRIRLDRARRFLDAAAIVHDNDLGPSSSVVARLCVLSGRAAADAACCFALGERVRGQDHREAEAMVARVPGAGGDMAMALRRLHGLEDEANDGLLQISDHKAIVALRRARRLVELAERVALRSRRAAGDASSAE